MNILFISLLDPSESGSGNQKVTLLSAKYLSSVGIHCFIAYFKDSEYSSSQLVFDAKFKIDYNDLEEIEKYNIKDIVPVVIIKKDNQEIIRIEGEKTKKEILDVLRSLS